MVAFLNKNHYHLDQATKYRTQFMKTKTCVLEPLASSSFCELWKCSDCGTVHLNLGAVSLRLTRDQAVDMADTMNKAFHHSETSPVSNQRDVVQKSIN